MTVMNRYDLCGFLVTANNWVLLLRNVLITNTFNLNYAQIYLLHTPKYGSWLNVAEIELNVLVGKSLGISPLIVFFSNS